MDTTTTPANEAKYLNRNDAIKAIRAALRKRSGKAWSVTGGRGTSYGWIHISAPLARRVDRDGNVTGEHRYYMSAADQAELTRLLGLARPCGHQYVSIPASSEYRAEYIARAEGRTPEVFGTPYWD